MDHTYSTSNGHYLLTNNAPFGSEKSAEFASPLYNSTRCLQFYYYRPQQARNIIEVATKDSIGL